MTVPPQRKKRKKGGKKAKLGKWLRWKVHWSSLQAQGPLAPMQNVRYMLTVLTALGDVYRRNPLSSTNQTNSEMTRRKKTESLFFSIDEYLVACIL